MPNLIVLQPTALLDELTEPFILVSSPIVDENGNTITLESNNSALLMLILQELRQLRVAMTTDDTI